MQVFRISLGLFLISEVWGQVTDDHLSFEVASIKPSANHSMVASVAGGPGTRDPSRFRATNAELSALVFRAYGLQYAAQLRRPAWTDKPQFDVVASVPPGATAEQFREMLQNLLVERFRMQVHHETRVEPVYELMVAKNGSKLKPAAQGDGTDDFVQGNGPRRADRDNFPILPPGRPNVACGHLPQGSYCTFRMVTIGMLVQSLSLELSDRPVIDKTGLTGRYDFTLYYSSMTNPPSSPDNDAPSLEQAVQEQLGLKMTPSKASIDVLVIDDAQKVPAEN